MCDFIKIFFACLEPIIIDLDIRRDELTKIKKELDDVESFLEYVESDIKKIGLYDNQNLIHQNLQSVDSDVSEYNAMVYLINSENPNIQKIPQYQISVKYMNKILDKFKTSFENMVKLHSDLSKEYKYKMLAKKYFDLFHEEEIFVIDNDEFINLFETLDLTNDDKKNILSYVIKSNVQYYQSNLSNNIEIDREQEIKKVQEIIYENKNLLSDEYSAFLEGVNKRVNLSLNIKRIINEETLAKIDVRNLILAKTIYLTNKINQSYKSCEFGLVSKYIKDYEELILLKEKIVDLKDKTEIIKIIKGGY